MVSTRQNKRWWGRKRWWGLAAAAAALFGFLWGNHRYQREARGAHTHIPSSEAVAMGYETHDLDAHATAWILAILMASAAAVVGIVFLMIAYLSQGDRARYAGFTAEQVAPIPTPPPTLQVHPFNDLGRQRAHEEYLLHSYGWLDAAHTHARIPIGRAMALEVGQSLDPSQ